MASINIKDVPDDLYQLLKRRAAREHRTIREQILASLARDLRPSRRSNAAMMLQFVETINENAASDCATKVTTFSDGGCTLERVSKAQS